MNNRKVPTRTTASNRVAPKNEVTTTRTPPPPATKTFYYNASPDIVLLIILGFIVIVALFVIWAFIGAISLFYVVPACIPIVSFLMNIYAKSSKRMTVTKDEIIFKSGTLTQRTQSVPTSKIRYCSKTSGVIQRLFGTMTIGITASGDSAEITFENIKNGDEAYELISQLAIRNGSDSSRA